MTKFLKYICIIFLFAIACIGGVRELGVHEVFVPASATPVFVASSSPALDYLPMPVQGINVFSMPGVQRRNTVEGGLLCLVKRAGVASLCGRASAGSKIHKINNSFVKPSVSFISLGRLII